MSVNDFPIKVFRSPLVNKNFYLEKYWPRVGKAGINLIKPKEKELKGFEEKR
jgi:hypothetical protein